MPGRAALAALALVTAAGEDAPLELPPNVELPARPVPRGVVSPSSAMSSALVQLPRGGRVRCLRGGLGSYS